ncbi:fungal-specific transcription factor domain-containing protein [Xylariaceae sp. FL0255]|nr:fungal-specific transcription factor domain-containing protein [Xylariaceae sp. FL0255]
MSVSNDSVEVAQPQVVEQARRASSFSADPPSQGSQEQGPVDGTAPAPRLIVNTRSCNECRRRKVSCDNLMPCSRCKRAQVTCVFPPPGRAPRRSRAGSTRKPPAVTRSNEAELRERLRKLEGTIDVLVRHINNSCGAAAKSLEIQEDLVHGTPTASSTSPQGTTECDTLKVPRLGSRGGNDEGPLVCESLVSHQGKLVFNKQESRYVSNGFLQDLNKKFQQFEILSETEDLPDEDDGCSSDTDAMSTGSSYDSPIDNYFVLGNTSGSSAKKDQVPVNVSPAHIAYLWLTYQENVEPLVKVLHVPSMNAVMKVARRDPNQLSPAHIALFWSICHIAVIALDEEEVHDNLAGHKKSLLREYRSALEWALARADFLNSCDITIMQALCLYLLALRCYGSTQSCWALTGLVIRLAQGMGLHRDGAYLELSPLETEIRRRVWWAIMLLDLRCAEESDTELATSDLMFDTKMPLNINDFALSAFSKEIPAPEIGWSDCAAAVVRYECSVLLKRSLRSKFAAEGSEKLDQDPEESNKKLDIVYRKLNEQILGHNSEDVELVHQFTTFVARILMSKIYLVAWHNSTLNTTGELSGNPTDQVYLTAIETVECNLTLNTKPRFKQYRWICLTYFNWRPIACVLLGLIHRPWTARAERGWQAVNGFNRNPVDIARKTDRIALFVPLRRLFRQAERHRSAEIARLKADPDEALRLDLAERTSSSRSRFGPLPGIEDRSEEIRMQWTRLFHPDNLEPNCDASNASCSTDPPADPMGVEIECVVDLGQHREPWESHYMREVPEDHAPPSTDLPPPIMVQQGTLSSLINSPILIPGAGWAMAAQFPNSNEQNIANSAHMAYIDQTPKLHGRVEVVTTQVLGSEPDTESNMWYDPLSSIDHMMETDIDMDAAATGERFGWGNWDENLQTSRENPTA